MVGNPRLERLLQRGALVIVCDLALERLTTRLARRAGANVNAVDAKFRASLIPTSVLVPSGIFGAPLAQNAGCAFLPT